MNRRATGVLALGAWLWACYDATGLPRGAIQFTPPAKYRAWWRLTESCSGVQGDLNAIRWYVLPKAGTFDLSGDTVNGAWYGDGNRIVIADSSLSDGELVRHEMLHALIRVPKHPRDQFLGRCGDIVACEDQCLADAGGPPDTSSNAVLADPRSLVASTLVLPNPVSLSADSGWTTFTVSLTNQNSWPVIAKVDSGEGFPITIVEYRALAPDRCDGIGLDYQFDYYIPFAPAGTPLATRRIVFDGQVKPCETYTVTGSFAEDAAPPVTLIVTH